MKIISYLYPQAKYTNLPKNEVPQNKQNIYFTSRQKTITSTFGAFSNATQDKLENLHINLQNIQEIFSIFTSNPNKAIAIKEGYKNPNMIQKNRNSGIAFKLPEGQGILTVKPLRVNNKLLRFILEKDGKVIHFITDGFNKAISNLSEKHPQFLPRKFKYMLPNEIKESNIEKYIEYADDEIQKYNKYLSKFKDSSVSPRSSKKASVNEVKNLKTVSETKIKVAKKDIEKIMSVFQKKPQELPEHIKPILSPSDSILGFNIKTDDNAILKVSKKINSKYGEDMAYLSFEKIFSNGDKSYMSIDMQTYKFLKMKDAGKPLIRGNKVYEYTQDEIIKRNMVEKFEAYTKEIFKDKKPLNQKPEQEIVKTTAEPVQEKPISEPVKSVENQPLEELKANTIKKAKEDANTLSDLYFKTFAEEFNKNITEKLNNFKVNLDKFIQDLWQK